MNNQPVKQVVGNIGAIYTTSNSGVPLATKQGAPFIRIAVSDANNQSHTISIFDAQTQQLIQQRGIGSGPWTFTGTEVTSPQGYVNFNLKSAVLQQQAPGQVEAQPVAPVPQQQPVVVGSHQWEDTIAGSWADNIDDRGRSIIRQVAFKDVPNKDDKTPEQIWNLTNIYEDILLGRFISESNGNVPNPAPPSDGSFVQQEF
tara:strand:- start:811 stop:1413 length:603 start_codon:yes stop_codon:yes gene_type:complete